MEEDGKRQASGREEEWMTIEDVGRHFKVSPKTVRKWLYQRKLRFYKIGGVVRIRREDVERFPMPVESVEDMVD